MGLPQVIGIRESLAFLGPHIVKGAAWLDAGCGAGELADALATRGARVTAIDPSAEAVAAARARGVDAHASRIEDFGGGPFDVVLFSRSLHHVASLEPALARAHALLQPGGALILEEFDVQAPDLATALFYYDTIDMLTRAGALEPEAHDHGRMKLAPLERWKDEHAHEGELHGAAAMEAAVRARFRVREVARVPYFFRTIAARSKDITLAEAYLEREAQRIAQGVVRPIGFRLVADRA